MRKPIATPFSEVLESARKEASGMTDGALRFRILHLEDALKEDHRSVFEKMAFSIAKRAFKDEINRRASHA